MSSGLSIDYPATICCERLHTRSYMHVTIITNTEDMFIFLALSAALSVIWHYQADDCPACLRFQFLFCREYAQLVFIIHGKQWNR